ncbi:MAG TPA: uroporphyrinogen decarboxylase family protein [bacterium]|nr:uroporphyrinogen decarboxylase family protein [bacterium]HRV04401.1 uroporphyrinogen decarboxylase family protein [Candidatus Ratteibacteria bacterium]
MTDRECFYASMNYQGRDRHPYWDLFGPWQETLEIWKKQGYDGRDDFGTDKLVQIQHIFDPFPQFERKIISETDRYRIFLNEDGVLMKEFKERKKSSMPQFIKFPVETKQEFRQFWKQRMKSDIALRIGNNWKEKLIDAEKSNCPFFITADRWTGFFGPLRNLVGIEKLCTLFYDEPVFVEEIMEGFLHHIITTMKQVLDVVHVDIFILWEDMAYHSGPLISPDMVKKYMLPRYKKLVEFLKNYGKKVSFIALDSDGNVDSLIPIWIDGGIDIIYPFEVQAGMDVVSLRKKYGKSLRMWGGFDKRIIAKSIQAIDEEAKRLTGLVEEGGYICGMDHSAPPDISFSNFKHFMKRMKEISKK